VEQKSSKPPQAPFKTSIIIEFVFCGHTLCAAEIFDVKVLTLDEWFYVAEAFDAKVMTLEEWHDRLSKS